MTAIEEHARSIFLAALERAPDRWPAFLDEACGDNAELRARVDQLLHSHQAMGSIHGGGAHAPPSPPWGRGVGGEGVGATMDDPITERPGTVIGPYKLLQQIGEGGMGTVFMAEQTHPIHRKVALKIIKPGMDSRQIIARFEAERQALAMMDHVNIARVFDGGTTGEPSRVSDRVMADDETRRLTPLGSPGRPYFVMELVHGVPITKYCDDNHLTPRERLELFVPVCQAIQHAHQKGIIHRDIKPSNVMVTLYDGKPVPKVIDFGVAKATEQKLTERTLFTQYGTMVGTLEYMSPEQAELSALGVDTRSDIYSLGVLLYELLTGSTPLTHKRMKEAAYAEILRMIKEEEPPKPSTRLSDSGEALASISANRHTEPAKLTKLVRGELDWIVMKTLEKDRNRRYETANGFAADVQRYLADEPVAAGPLSVTYRLRKFVRRNKGPVVAASLVLLALVVGIVGTTCGLIGAERARRDAVTAQLAEADRAEGERLAKLDAETQKTKAQEAAAAEAKERQRAQANEKTANEREAETRAVLDFVLIRVFAAARPKDQAGGMGYDVKLADAVRAALPFVERSFPQQPLIEARLRMTLGKSFRYLGEAPLAAEQYQRARALYTQHSGPDHPSTLTSMSHLAVTYQALGRPADAIKLIEETLARMKAKLDPDHPDTLASMSNLATSYHALGRTADAIKLIEETLPRMKAKLDPDHPDTLHSTNNLANLYYALGRHPDALKLREETLALRKAKLGSDHPDTLASMNNLATSYQALGRHVDAFRLFEKTLALRKATLGPDHPETLMSMSNLASSYRTLGRPADAIKLIEETLALTKAKLGPDHPDTLRIMHNLAAGYYALGRHPDALQLREETLALQKAKFGPDHPDTLFSMWGLAESLVKLDRGAEAVPIIDECVRRATGKLVDPRMIPAVIVLRLRHFARSKDAAGCRGTAEIWERQNRADADSLYAAACMRGVTAAVLKQDPGADAARLAKEEADRAMAWLHKAVAAGYKDAASLKKANEFAALRDREDFQKLLAELEASTEKQKK